MMHTYGTSLLKITNLPLNTRLSWGKYTQVGKAIEMNSLALIGGDAI